MAIDLKLNLDRILKLPLAYRVLILAGVWLIIGGLYYSFLYSPKVVEAGNLRGQLEELKKRVDTNRNIAKDLPGFKKEKEDLGNELKKALTQLPDKEEIPNLLEAVSTAGKTSGLEILVFKPGVSAPKGFYAEIPVDMKVEGRYESLALFFEKVGGLPRIVNLSGVNIGGVKDVKGEIFLTSDFKATTFMFLEEAERPEPKKKATDAGKGERK